tara:strand:- start:127 stop:507 length:381 start_codon:yes stop_codon:yes gene_type:complete
MKNRIQIDGVWYVKEKDTNNTNTEIDYTWSESCIVENEKYILEAIRIRTKMMGEFYKDVNIDIKDKKTNNTICIDNTDYMLNLYDQEYIEDWKETLEAVFNNDTMVETMLKDLILKLIQADWLRYE